MDKWKDIELEKMKVGGNKNAREFFDSQESWNDSDSISKRYNSIAAELYRDKISILAEGREWDMKSAKQSIEKKKKSLPQSKSVGAMSTYQNDEFSYQNAANSREVYEQKERYFDRIQMENAMRPSDLPPNQGGKYTGKGYCLNFVSDTLEFVTPVASQLLKRVETVSNQLQFNVSHNYRDTLSCNCCI